LPIKKARPAQRRSSDTITETGHMTCHRAVRSLAGAGAMSVVTSPRGPGFW
jgi:hypothetical protein